MKIALLGNEESVSTKKLCSALSDLGHNVVCIDTCNEMTASRMILDNNIEYIFISKDYGYATYRIAYRLSIILKIPVVDFVWCYKNFSLLLNSRKCRNSCAVAMNEQLYKRCLF